MAFAIYLTYLFTLGAFDLNHEQWIKNLVLIFGIVTASYLMIFYEYEKTMLDLIGFLLCCLGVALVIIGFWVIINIGG